jgi:hypothetical protein
MIWAAGNRSRGACGVFGCSGPSHIPGHPVRAVPLAAVIPSRVPGRGRGAWGGPASEEAVRRGQSKTAPAPPGDGGGADSCWPPCSIARPAKSPSGFLPDLADAVAGQPPRRCVAVQTARRRTAGRAGVAKVKPARAVVGEDAAGFAEHCAGANAYAGIGLVPRRTGPTWKQFLTAQARGIACRLQRTLGRHPGHLTSKEIGTPAAWPPEALGRPPQAHRRARPRQARHQRSA